VGFTARAWAVKRVFEKSEPGKRKERNVGWIILIRGGEEMANIRGTISL